MYDDSVFHGISYTPSVHETLAYLRVIINRVCRGTVHTYVLLQCVYFEFPFIALDISNLFAKRNNSFGTSHFFNKRAKCNGTNEYMHSFGTNQLVKCLFF